MLSGKGGRDDVKLDMGPRCEDVEVGIGGFGRWLIRYGVVANVRL